MSYLKKILLQKTPSEGIAIPRVLFPFDKSFHNDTYNAWCNFFIRNKKHTKWLILSDYVFDDPSKPNNVAIFSIIPAFPYIEHPQVINNKLPRDFKKTTNISKDAISFLKRDDIFTIALLFPASRDEYIIFPQYDRQKNWKKVFEMLSDLLNTWIETTPSEEQKEIYKTIKIRFDKILNNFKKNEKLYLLNIIFSIAAFVAYLTLEISKVNETELVGWSSDRDKILSFKTNKDDPQPFIFDLIYAYNHIFSYYSHSRKTTKMCFLASKLNERIIEFDYLNRIPDFFAGVFADFNFQAKTTTSIKAGDLLNEVLLNNQNIQIYKLESPNLVKQIFLSRNN